MKFGGEIYDTQFTTRTGKKENNVMYDMHKLAVDVTFNQMTTKKDIKNMDKERWSPCIINIHNWKT